MQAKVETAVTDTTETASPLETSFGNEQPVVTVPYSSLRPSPLNVRTQSLSGIEGLAASIHAKGLLQNLVVHEMKSSRSKRQSYGVCGGRRREAALDLLFGQKHIAADSPVPVRVVSKGEALAISLIEISEREGLDPFDVLRAYRMLAEEGRSVGLTGSTSMTLPSGPSGPHSKRPFWPGPPPRKRRHGKAVQHEHNGSQWERVGESSS